MYRITGIAVRGFVLIILLILVADPFALALNAADITSIAQQVHKEYSTGLISDDEYEMFLKSNVPPGVPISPDELRQKRGNCSKLQLLCPPDSALSVWTSLQEMYLLRLLRDYDAVFEFGTKWIETQGFSPCAEWVGNDLIGLLSSTPTDKLHIAWPEREALVDKVCNLVRNACPTKTFEYASMRLVAANAIQNIGYFRVQFCHYRYQAAFCSAL